MQRYCLKVIEAKNDGRGKEVLVIIVTRALDDDEALCAAHAVTDMAESNGAENAVVAVSAADSREVGFVGFDDPDEDYLERSERKAKTYKPPNSSN
jgi:hypothetical protein